MQVGRQVVEQLVAPRGRKADVTTPTRSRLGPRHCPCGEALPCLYLLLMLLSIFLIPILHYNLIPGKRTVFTTDVPHSACFCVNVLN